MRPSRAYGFAAPSSPWFHLAKYPNLWRGCVGSWAHILGPTGATLFDVSGRANHAALTNLTARWEVGRFGPYISHPGLGSYFGEIAGANAGPLALIGTGDFTVTAFVTITSSSSYHWVISNWAYAGIHFGVLNVGGEHRIEAFVGSGSPIELTGSTSTKLTAGEWHFIALRRLNGVCTVRRDFTTDANTLANSSTMSSAAATRIGCRGDSSSDQLWNGGIAEIGVFSTALPDEQLNALAMRPGIMHEIDEDDLFAALSSGGGVNRRRRLLMACG